MAFNLARICEIIQKPGLKSQEWQPLWTSPEVAPFFLPVKSVSLFFGISLKHISEFNKIEILQFICLLKSLLFDIICLWCTEWKISSEIQSSDLTFGLSILLHLVFEVSMTQILQNFELLGVIFAWIGLNQNF